MLGVAAFLVISYLTHRVQEKEEAHAAAEQEKFERQRRMNTKREGNKSGKPSPEADATQSSDYPSFEQQIEEMFEHEQIPPQPPPFDEMLSFLYEGKGVYVRDAESQTKSTDPVEAEDNSQKREKRLPIQGIAHASSSIKDIQKRVQSTVAQLKEDAQKNSSGRNVKFESSRVKKEGQEVKEGEVSKIRYAKNTAPAITHLSARINLGAKLRSAENLKEYIVISSILGAPKALAEDEWQMKN